MAEILVTPKISEGWRIALTKELCDQMKLNVGERILIIRRDDGEIVLCKNEAVV
jgi:bifunctional DNA-binding transcriptional regulator/antitoxin component of YhaV-PrlF toxin-antitoxin module